MLIKRLSLFSTFELIKIDITYFRCVENNNTNMYFLDN